MKNSLLFIMLSMALLSACTTGAISRNDAPIGGIGSSHIEEIPICPDSPLGGIHPSNHRNSNFSGAKPAYTAFKPWGVKGISVDTTGNSATGDERVVSIFKRLIQSNRPLIHNCLNKHLKEVPIDAKNALSIKLSINSDQSRFKVESIETVIKNSGLKNCLKSKIESWYTGVLGGNAVYSVEYPFPFCRAPSVNSTNLNGSSKSSSTNGD